MEALSWCEKKNSDRADWNVLQWFGHVESMSEERFTKRVYKSEVVGRNNRGSLCTRWLHVVKKECKVFLKVMLIDTTLC